MAKTGFSRGSQVEVKTTHGEEVKGEVFCYDKYTDTLVLKEAGDGLRILKGDCLAQPTNIADTASEESPDLPAVDMARCEAREAKALKAAEEAAARIGVGVTKEAQAMFDALGRTMPVRWEGTTIVVLDEVRISAPYDSASATSGPEGKPTLERVKLVIDYERAKMTGSNE